MSKHTPGPWVYKRENGSPTTGQHMIAGAIPGYLAEVRDCGSGDVEANARLIAAAPELLVALEHIKEYWNRDQNEQAMSDALWHIIETADDAIAKATGGAA